MRFEVIRMGQYEVYGLWSSRVLHRVVWYVWTQLPGATSIRSVILVSIKRFNFRIKHLLKCRNRKLNENNFKPFYLRL
jgi:uncharacterized membrane protein